jgi:hypothetical protein
MSRVFVPNEPFRTINGEPVPIFDLTPAARYGELVVLSTGRFAALSTMPMVARLRKKMKDFCDDDYIVAVGDPAVIGMTCAVAAHFNCGRFRLLKWDKNERTYIQLNMDISGRNL